jgi:hypothetical protein
MSCVAAVLVKSPVTSDGVINNVVNCEFGVLIVVSSTVRGEPPLKAPPMSPPTVLISHCVVVMAEAKLPLLCAEAKGDAIIANAAMIPGSNSL